MSAIIQTWLEIELPILSNSTQSTARVLDWADYTSAYQPPHASTHILAVEPPTPLSFICCFQIT